MADYVLKTIKDKDVLRDRADEIVLVFNDRPRIKGIINDLKETIKCNPSLVALAAPQLGHKERIFVIKFANGDVRAFINPAIIRSEGMHLSREVAIGIDDKEYLVPRCDEIYATYQTPDMIGDRCDMNKFSGPVAEVFQQMNDLLNGVLLEDIGLELLDGWDEASPEEREEIIAMYLDSLKSIQTKIQEKIDSNPESKEMSKAIEFMTKLQLGEIETVPLTEEEKKKVEEVEKAKAQNENNN